MKNEATIDGITVGGQPSPDDLAAGRFATVINLRKDDEPGNVTQALVAGKNVHYVHVPVTIEAIERDDIVRVREAVDASNGPVLIHWMGGTRAAVAAAIVAAERDGSGKAGARKKVADAGFAIAETPYDAFVESYFTTDSRV